MGEQEQEAELAQERVQAFSTMGCGASTTAIEDHVKEEKQLATKVKETLAELNARVGAALKEALKEATESACNKITTAGKIEVATPAELGTFIEKLKGLPLSPFDTQITQFEATMKSAAAHSVPGCKPLFNQAIEELSVDDARVLFENKLAQSSATAYLRVKCEADMIAKCLPVIKAKIDEDTLSKVWDVLVTGHNVLPFVDEIHFDLPMYVCKCTVAEVFNQIEIEEEEVRKMPTKSSCAVVRDIFGNLTGLYAGYEDQSGSIVPDPASLIAGSYKCADMTYEVRFAGVGRVSVKGAFSFELSLKEGNIWEGTAQPNGSPHAIMFSWAFEEDKQSFTLEDSRFSDKAVYNKQSAPRQGGL